MEKIANKQFFFRLIFSKNFPKITNEVIYLQQLLKKK